MYAFYDCALYQKGIYIFPCGGSIPFSDWTPWSILCDDVPLWWTNIQPAYLHTQLPGSKHISSIETLLKEEPLGL